VSLVSIGRSVRGLFNFTGLASSEMQKSKTLAISKAVVGRGSFDVEYLECAGRMVGLNGG